MSSLEQAVESSRESVSVSGIGIVSCLGSDLDSVWKNLEKGVTGLKSNAAFDDGRCNSSLCGRVTESYPENVEERMFSFTKDSLRNCIADLNLSDQASEGAKKALVYSSSLGAIYNPDSEPVEIDKFIPKLKLDMGLDFPVLSITSACSSSTDAISIGMDLIQYEGYDVVFCGGVDAVDLYKMRGHSSLSTLSSSLCTPFGSDSDGTMLGEGGCFLALVSRKFADKHDLKDYGRIAGRGNSTDVESLTTPDESGEIAANAIRNAIEDAGLDAKDISYINAHGSGTTINDAMECNIYKNIFSNYKTLISSTKGAFGHTLGATGAIEAVVSLLALSKGIAPPTTNVKEADESWLDTGIVIGAPSLIKSGNASLSVTYGFGGANSCLVFTNPNIC